MNGKRKGEKVRSEARFLKAHGTQWTGQRAETKRGRLTLEKRHKERTHEREVTETRRKRATYKEIRRHKSGRWKEFKKRESANKKHKSDENSRCLTTLLSVKFMPSRVNEPGWLVPCWRRWWWWYSVGAEKIRRKHCHITSFVITNSSWTGLVPNPGLGGERLGAKNLSHGTNFAENMWREEWRMKRRRK